MRTTNPTKVCPRCGHKKDRFADFNIKKTEGKVTTQPYCKECMIEYRNSDHPSYHENPNCNQYLGILIEHAMADAFKAVRAPMNTEGYDFTCPRGYKIDSKASNLQKTGCYHFRIKENKTADYFACVAVDRANLRIKYLWYIPGKEVNHMINLIIKPGSPSWDKYAKYLKPIEKIAETCEMKKKEAQL